MRTDPATPGGPWSRRSFLTAAACGTAGAVLGDPAAAQEKKPEDLKKRTDEAVARGLEWLKKTQSAAGHWAVGNNQYPVSMTGLAGMCLLMEGSTLKEGKYSNEIQKAVDWLLARQQANGLIADPRDPRETARYLYGQGFATLFLSCAYGDAEDEEKQKKIETCLTKAVEFICKAQTDKKHQLPEGKQVDVGGWGYVSPADARRDFDEGSVTITQLQALRAARNALIPVPKETINKALAYLEACTTPNGGVIYSYSQAGGNARNGAERIPLTAAAVACSFSAGQYKGELAKKWIKFCKEKIPLAQGRQAHDEYQSYYYSQAVYVLGEDRYGELFPNEDKKNWLTWSKYRDVMFPYILDQQEKMSGAWTTGSVGPVFVTAVNLTILQLDKGILPIYQR